MAQAAPCTCSASTSGGRLVGAVSFGWQAAGGRRLPGVAAARARAAALAADLGLDVAGQPEVRQEPDETGWAIAWPRVVDGIPVPGDGVRVDLWPDGRVHAVVRTERPLAARPPALIDEAAARARAGRHLADLFGEPLGAGRDRRRPRSAGSPRTTRSSPRRRTPPTPRSGSPGSSKPAHGAI